MIDIATHLIAFGAGGVITSGLAMIENARWRKHLIAELAEATADKGRLSGELLLTENYMYNENEQLRRILDRAVVRDAKGRFMAPVRS